MGFTGGLAELATVREDRIARMPANCTFEQAAAVQVSGVMTPVIDRVYPLVEALDALRYVEDGHPKGKVVVTVGGERSDADEPALPL